MQRTCEDEEWERTPQHIAEDSIGSQRRRPIAGPIDVSQIKHT